MTNPLFPTIGIAGIGLIGGSLAKDLRTFGLAGRILGWNRTAAHAERALELGLVDETLPTLEDLAAQSDLLVLAMPVDILVRRLPRLLDAARPGQTLIDVGSTKRALAEAAADHPNRPRYVACHPMAGTERSGPDAAIDNLFRNRFTLIIGPPPSTTAPPPSSPTCPTSWPTPSPAPSRKPSATKPSTPASPAAASPP